MIILWILIGLIVFIFAFHFICLEINIRIRRNNIKKNLKTWSWESKNRKFRIARICNHDLMITKTQYSFYDVDDDKRDYAKSISLEIGGFYISFKYSKDFLMDIHYSDDSKSSHYGFYSIDGERFWRAIWIGDKLYYNIFTPEKFLGCWIYDIENNKLIDNELLDKYSDKYNPNIEFPYITILKNCEYTDKDQETYQVDEIRWWLEERRWTLPILYWLGLSKLYTKKVIALSFDSDTELGIERGSWKGGVMGSCIKLNTDSERELYEDYIFTRKYFGYKPLFHHKLKTRIADFMETDQLY